MSNRLSKLLSALLGIGFVVGLALLVPALAQGGGSPSSPPVNDRIDEAIYLSALADDGGTVTPAVSLAPIPVSDAVDATLATAPAGETYLSTPTVASVWWRWRAPSSAPFEFSTAGSTVGTRIEVFTGSIGALVSQGSAQGIVGSDAAVSVSTAADTEYFILVDQHNGTGTVELTIDFDRPAPSNDNFAGALDLTGSEFSCVTAPADQCLALVGHTGRSSSEASEPDHGGEPAARSVWYSWTPAAAGVVTLDTCNSAFDTTVGVYTGTSVASLVAVAANDDADPTECDDPLGRGYSETTFIVNPGTVYWIAFDGFVGDSGQVKGQLHVAPPAATCNGLAVTVDLNLGQVPTAGDDVILGTSAAEIIQGLGGDDTICGGDGDDTIAGGNGADTILGELGDDTVYGGNGSDTISGGPGNDTLQGNNQADTVQGDAGDDVLAGNAADDILSGGDGNDTLYGEIGNDTIDGDAGDDTVLGGGGADIINGGDGVDLVSGNAGDDQISGDAGADTLYGANDNDTILGGDGNDAILGGAGDDDISGEAGEDRLSGSDGDDTISGGADDDDLYGVGGADTLNGDAGIDTILGGDDDDVISGGDGDDLLSGNGGNDTIDGGAGADEIYGVNGLDILTGGDGPDIVLGGLGNDTINTVGDGSVDQVSGNGGTDTCNVDTGPVTVDATFQCELP